MVQLAQIAEAYFCLASITWVGPMAYRLTDAVCFCSTLPCNSAPTTPTNCLTSPMWAETKLFFLTVLAQRCNLRGHDGELGCRLGQIEVSLGVFDRFLRGCFGGVGLFVV